MGIGWYRSLPASGHRHSASACWRTGTGTPRGLDVQIGIAGSAGTEGTARTHGIVNGDGTSDAVVRRAVWIWVGASCTDAFSRRRKQAVKAGHGFILGMLVG